MWVCVGGIESAGCAFVKTLVATHTKHGGGTRALKDRKGSNPRPPHKYYTHRDSFCWGHPDYYKII